MADEITQNPAPVDAPSEIAAETPQMDAPVVVALELPPIIPEPQTAQLGGNEPFTPVSIETQPTPIPAENPTPEVAPIETTHSISPEPAPVITTEAVASVVTPVIATAITQPFTKSMRELFTKAQLAIQNRKRKKLDRILTLFVKQTMITNNEVEKLLHVSDATATRYLSTLEKEGKIKQNKKTGKGVSYSKI